VKNEVRVEFKNINAISFDLIISRVVAAEWEGKGEKFVLDLRDVEFIDPYGIVCLFVLARYLNSRFQEVFFALPNNRDTRNYLSRMNFIDTLEPLVKFTNTSKYDFHYKRGVDSEVLLEVTEIENMEDVEQVTSRALNRINSILTEHLQYKEKDIAAFCTALSEVCSNIRDHSEDKGVVAVQRYVDKEGRNFVVIGVADLGIGIKRSLGLRYNVADWSDAKAILNALKPHFSRFEGRGLGLPTVKDITHRYSGGIHVRSGSTRVYFLSQKARFFHSSPFLGTQICLTLYEA
jgi:anti-sigma regulatory factor (Ser/Thr protein kinase)